MFDGKKRANVNVQRANRADRVQFEEDGLSTAGTARQREAAAQGKRQRPVWLRCVCSLLEGANSAILSWKTNRLFDFSQDVCFHSIKLQNALTEKPAERCAHPSPFARCTWKRRKAVDAEAMSV